MRIALLNSLFPQLGIGGSEMSVFYLAKGLRRIGHTVRVFSENTDEDDVEETVEGVDVFRSGSKRGYGPNVFAEPKLQRLYMRDRSLPDQPLTERISGPLLEFQPNVVHTNVIGGLRDFWALANAYGIPAVHTLRSYTLLCGRRMLRGSDPCTRQCATCLNGSRMKARDDSNRVRGVTGISNHILSVHGDAGWFANVAKKRVVANSYEADSQDPAQLCADKPFHFGYIGRLHETKGVDVFLRALEQVQRRRPEAQIKALVAGDGNPEYVAALKKRFVGVATFGGYMKQGEFFSQVRFCVAPSLWYEPFGRVFVEALHHGVPVIGSVRGGGAEIIGPGNGWLFDPDHGDVLEELLYTAVSLSQHEYREKVAACVETSSQYSVERIAESYSEFYRECVDD